MADFSNKYGVARINQEGERLFTVRPRYYASSEDNPPRGDALLRSGCVPSYDEPG